MHQTDYPSDNSINQLPTSNYKLQTTNYKLLTFPRLLRAAFFSTLREIGEFFARYVEQ